MCSMRRYVLPPELPSRKLTMCSTFPDFDYCERCEKQPPAVNLSGDTTHKVDHEMIKIPWPLTRFTVRVYKSKAAEVLKKRLGATDPTKKRKATNTEDESESEEEEEEEDDDDDDDDEGGGSGGGDGGGEENGEESEDEDTDPDELEAIYDRVLAHDKFTDGDEEKGAAAEPDKATATDAGNAQPSTEVPTSAVDTPTTPPITSNSLAALATQTGADTEAIVSKPVRTYSCSNGCGRNDLILHYVCLDCDDGTQPRIWFVIKELNYYDFQTIFSAQSAMKLSLKLIAMALPSPRRKLSQRRQLITRRKLAQVTSLSPRKPNRRSQTQRKANLRLTKKIPREGDLMKTKAPRRRRLRQRGARRSPPPSPRKERRNPLRKLVRDQARLHLKRRTRTRHYSPRSMTESTSYL
jgi:hypothetical protein